MEIWIVDRIEGGIAVCENDAREMREIPLSELPEGVREGSVLRAAPGGLVIDPGAEETRRRRILELEEKLFGKR